MRTRITGVDIARGLALLGIIVNHIFFYSHHFVAQALQDYHAILFMLLAGIVFTYAQGDQPVLKNIIRGIICIVLGLGLGAGDPRMELILLNYGWLFIFGALFVYRFSARQLFIISGVWVIAAPFISYFIRSYTGTPINSNIGFQHLVSEPWMILADPVLFSSYPLLQWFAVFLFGAALGKGAITHTVTDTRANIKMLLLALTAFIIAKGIPLLVNTSAQGYSWAQAFDQNFKLGFGNVDANGLSSLVTSAPYTATTFALVASTSAALVVVALCTMLAKVTSLSLVQHMGMATLTLYSLHAFIHTLVPMAWADANSTLYYIITIAVLALLTYLWRTFLMGKHGVQAPGPIEELTRRVVLTESKKRQVTASE